MSYSEVHRLPIRYRHWFLRRLLRHFERKNEEITKNIDKNKNMQGNNLDLFSRFEGQVKNKLS
tara:strand:+ start:358 stop:546 length:189 start_codon:yes stop_codon:yes gene_type:complete